MAVTFCLSLEDCVADEQKVESNDVQNDTCMV